MQIGADIFCDTQCILRELERRHPEPSFMPTSEAGLMWCLSRWTDGNMFDLAVKIVLGSAGDDLPQDFAEDRGRLYLGQNWAENLKAANMQLPHLVSQVRAPFSWLNDQLADGRRFLLGASPAAIDAQIYYAIWFLRGRWADGPQMLSEFPELVRWETNVRDLGHGTSTAMTPEDALARGRILGTWRRTLASHPNDPPRSDGGFVRRDPPGRRRWRATRRRAGPPCQCGNRCRRSDTRGHREHLRSLSARRLPH